MFALHIPSTFGDSIDGRINGKPKRVTWRDAHTLVIEADPYATAPVDTEKFGANWTGLEALARIGLDHQRMRIAPGDTLRFSEPLQTTDILYYERNQPHDR